MKTLPKPRPELFASLPGDVVAVFEPFTEASPVAMATQFAVAFGCAVGGGPRFYVGETAHRTNEFLMLPGDTARGRKGDAGNIVRALFEEADQDWAAHRWKSGLSSGEGLIFNVRDGVTKVATEGKNAGKTVVVDEGVEDKRLLAYETEASAVLKQTDRKGNTLSNVTRDAWDHRSLSTLTRHNPLTATNPHISIIAHCTVEDLLAHLTNTEVANGWANRFMFAATHRDKLLASPGRADRLSVEALADAVREALQFARGVGEMQRTPSAERLWCAVYGRLSADQIGLFGQLTARAEAHVVRLSMLYALFCGSRVIDEDHLRSALAFWLYCFESTRLIFGQRTGNGDADRIKEGLLPGESMSFSDIREDIFSGHIPAARLQTAVDLLIRTNEVRLEEESTGGRPAKVVYRLKDVEKQKSEESWESAFEQPAEFADDAREVGT